MAELRRSMIADLSTTKGAHRSLFVTVLVFPAIGLNVATPPWTFNLQSPRPALRGGHEPIQQKMDPPSTALPKARNKSGQQGGRRGDDLRRTCPPAPRRPLRHGLGSKDDKDSEEDDSTRGQLGDDASGRCPNTAKTLHGRRANEGRRLNVS